MVFFHPTQEECPLPPCVKAQKCFCETLPKGLGTNKGLKTGSPRWGTGNLLPAYYTQLHLVYQASSSKGKQGSLEHHEASCEALNHLHPWQTCEYT